MSHEKASAASAGIEPVALSSRRPNEDALWAAYQARLAEIDADLKAAFDAAAAAPDPGMARFKAVIACKRAEDKALWDYWHAIS